MIKTISHYIYFFLWSVFLMLMLLSSFFEKEISLNSNIVYLYTILLIPLFDYLVTVLRQENNIFSFSLPKITKKEFVKYMSFGVFLIFLIFYKKYDFWVVGILSFLVISFLWKWDSRISFFMALMILVYIPIYLIMWEKDFAEKMSIYAYYFLIIWVVVELWKTISFKKI